MFNDRSVYHDYIATLGSATDMVTSIDSDMETTKQITVIETLIIGCQPLNNFRRLGRIDTI